MDNFLLIFFQLLMAHAVTDFALQTEFIALSKSRYTTPKYLDKDHLPMWPYTLTAHALINAAGVWLVTRRFDLALWELIIHCLVDFIKCEKLLNLHYDQLLHVCSKFLFAFFMLIINPV